MATHCSILAREIPGTEGPGGLTVHGGRKEPDTTGGLSTRTPVPGQLDIERFSSADRLRFQS